jgi:Spy/CpxP family protein refolding chaperone
MDRENMKKSSLLVVVALLVSALALEAGQRGGRGRPMDVEHRLGQMQKQLNLTSDQVDKIRPILQDQNRRIEDLRAKNQNDGSTGRSSFMNGMRQIRQDSMKRIETVLTPDQVTRFHQLQRSRGNFQGKTEK